MTRIRIAIQKRGKLHDSTMKLFKKCGLSLSSSNSYLLKVSNFPMDIILLRDDDVPAIVASLSCDWGIVGLDVYKEYLLSKDSKMSNNPLQREYLNYGYCRLSIAAPPTFPYQNSKSLNNKKIATSYPMLLREFLVTDAVEAHIIPMHGSVEIAPKINIADAICDLVSSGATIQENNLIEYDTVMESRAVIVSRKEQERQKEKLYQEFLRVIQSVMTAEDKRYLMLNCHEAHLQKILSILPHAESPTVLKLANSQMNAIHTLCEQQLVHTTIQKLKQANASSILVLPVEKMVI